MVLYLAWHVVAGGAQQFVSKMLAKRVDVLGVGAQFALLFSLPV